VDVEVDILVVVGCPDQQDRGQQAHRIPNVDRSLMMFVTVVAIDEHEVFSLAHYEWGRIGNRVQRFRLTMRREVQLNLSTVLRALNMMTCFSYFIFHYSFLFFSFRPIDCIKRELI
jgi:hypothetical protein